MTEDQKFLPAHHHGRFCPPACPEWRRSTDHTLPGSIAGVHADDIERLLPTFPSTPTRSGPMTEGHEGLDERRRWALSNRADDEARVIADRHYNRQKVGSPQFVPPGRCMVLLADHALWVTSWPFAEYVKHEWPGAWINSCFRKECPGLASEYIREAVSITCWYADVHWRMPIPTLGMVTFVDESKVRHKRDPGRSYLRAGFRPVGKTKGGLLAFQMLPDDMPEPLEPMPENGALIAI